MSTEVTMNSQTKRPDPKCTLEFKQDAARLVNEGLCPPARRGALEAKAAAKLSVIGCLAFYNGKRAQF